MDRSEIVAAYQVDSHGMIRSPLVRAAYEPDEDEPDESDDEESNDES